MAKVGAKKRFRGVPFHLDFNQITHQIYLGTNMCCLPHFQALRRMGIRADIDLELDMVQRPEPLEVFVWLPVKDHSAPTQLQLRTGVGVIDELVRSEIKIYIHCKNGHGRAPTLLAAYFISQGMSIANAVKFLKSKRPVVHLNKVQLQGLDEFQRSLKRGK